MIKSLRYKFNTTSYHTIPFSLLIFLQLTSIAFGKVFIDCHHSCLDSVDLSNNFCSVKGKVLIDAIVPVMPVYMIKQKWLFPTNQSFLKTFQIALIG